MNRETFINRLEQLLSDIPKTERDEALNYYEDYIEDAGEENEEEVIASLGSPEKIAQNIREGLQQNRAEGEYSEKGYSYGKEQKDEVAITTQNAGAKGKKGPTTSMVILLIILGVFALPILGPIAIAALSIVFAIFCVIASLIFAVFILGVALLLAGIVAVIAGIVTLVTNILAGSLAIGVGLLLFGIGLFITWLGILIIIKAIPPMVRGFVNLCKKPFSKKGV